MSIKAVRDMSLKNLMLLEELAAKLMAEVR